MTEETKPLDEQILANAIDLVDETGLPPNTPSPREILERAQAIQAKWTDKERTSRSIGQCERDPYEIPETKSRAGPKRKGGPRGSK